MTGPPAQTLATHVLNQTLANILILETINLISSSDAHLIRSKLPSPTGPFPTLEPSRDVTASFGGLSMNSPNQSYAQQLPPQSQTQSQSQLSPNYQVQQYQSASQPGPPALPPRGRGEQRAKALWDYSGAEPDDLTFRSGDTILIDDEVNEQWYRGRVIPQGQSYPLERSGLFPSNYVEKQQSGSYYQSPPPAQMVPYNPPGPAQPYSYEKHNYGPPVPIPPTQQYGGMMQQQQQPPQTVVVSHEEKKSKFGKIGGQLGHAAVNGFGFGAGAAVAGDLVHKIF